MRTDSVKVPGSPSWQGLFPSALIAVFAFVFCWQAGRRGFFPFDQSLVFDGAYRVVKGQTIYRDFVVPTGPVVFWLQSLFFLVGGVTYPSYLAHAALGNCLAVLAVIFILKYCYPSDRWVPYVGALLTAIWFYPPSGTPFFEQTAFLLVLLSAALILGSTTLARRSARSLAIVLAGACAGSAFLAKQNAGLFSAPLLAGLVVVSSRDSWKAVLTRGVLFSLGVVALGLAFGLWLSWYSDPQRFWRHFWSIPAEEGSRRLIGNGWHVLRFLVIGPGPIPARVALALSNLATALVLCIDLRNAGRGGEPRREVTAGYLALGAALTQGLFAVSTNNQQVNSQPFLGLIVAAGIASARRMLRMSAVVSDETEPRALPGRGLPRWIVPAAYGGLACWVGWTGYRAARERVVHDVFEGADFSLKCDVPILGYVDWSDKAGGKGQLLTPGELEAVVRALREDGRRFLVLNDYTILYAMLDQPPPQPLVWFHRGLTYPKSYDQGLDRWVVDSLERQRVELVLLEEDAWWGVEETLENFPLVKQYIDERFSPLPSVGHFRFLERRAREGDLSTRGGGKSSGVIDSIRPSGHRGPA